MFCSQGAVFDGVKLNLAGEQGQVARQLMQQSQTLHRSPIALINFADKKRQFVAVTYDRCKLAVVQASSLMKQVESKRRKLQLTVGGSGGLGWRICLAFVACGAGDYAVHGDQLVVAGRMRGGVRRQGVHGARVLVERNHRRPHSTHARA
jgi:hypothetical protein